jgi:hypothetical protein
VTETDALQHLQRLARAAGASEIAAEAGALAGRAAEGRFFLACVGEFKRGKSSLINALLGTTILPTGVLPVTSVPTIVRYGDEGARVLQNGRWHEIAPGQVVDYVSQDRNPGNRKSVVGIEVFLPHALLQGGLCLVDTPGLGSVFDANTASTHEFLPHIDAVLLVAGADPPISGEERALMTKLATQVGAVLCVLNKADRIRPEERAQALGFTQTVLEQAVGRAVEPIYEVSAVAGERGPAAVHGWAELVDALARLPRESGRRLVAGAVRRGTDRLRTRLASLLDEERRALLAPLEESDRRLAALRELADSAERARRELTPLLEAEARRLRADFEHRRARFLADALPRAQAEVGERLDVRRSRNAALELAAEVAQAHLGPWLAQSEREAAVAYGAAVSRFVAIAREFLHRIGATDDVAGQTLPADEDVSSAGELRAPRGFYFTHLLSQHQSPLPWAGMFDRLAPAWLGGRRRRRAALRYLEHLLIVNASRVESDLCERVEESGRRLRADLSGALAQVGLAAVRAVERGLEARRTGAEAVAAATARLDGWLEELRSASVDSTAVEVS